MAEDVDKKPFWESQLFGIVAGAIIAAVAGQCTAQVTAQTQLETTQLTTKNELRLARMKAKAEDRLRRNADADARRERRKVTARDFIFACSEMGVAFYEAGQSTTVSDMNVALLRMAKSNATYLTAFAATSADFPEVSGIELPKNRVALPAGPAVNEGTMDAAKKFLTEGAKTFTIGCEDHGTRLLIALRAEHTRRGH